MERELTGEMIALEKQLVFMDTELVKMPEEKEKGGGVWPVELEKGFRENKILRISMFKDKKRY